MIHSKKISIFVFALMLTVLPSLFAFPEKGAHTKFARGVTDVVSSPWQLPKEIIQKTSDAGDRGPAVIAPTVGFFHGSATGIYHWVRQALSGIADIVTFGAPMNNNWDPIIPQASKTPEI